MADMLINSKFQMGDLELKNRVVLAPLTRARWSVPVFYNA